MQLLLYFVRMIYIVGVLPTSISQSRYIVQLWHVCLLN